MEIEPPETPSPPAIERVERQRLARRIGLHHLAFFRGHVEGVELATLGERFLETGADLRAAKKTLTWIRDELVAAARRRRPELARLLKIAPAKLAVLPATAAGPSFALFQEEMDPDGEFSEHELLTMFEERFGPAMDPVTARKSKRNERLRKRLLEAVRWLDGWLPQSPELADPVEVWLDEAMADRLHRAGVSTLEQLVTLIRKRGEKWYRKVPKLGSIGAGRIRHWLQTRDLLGPEKLLPATRQSLAALGRPTGALVPLEALVLPEEFSGVTGANRNYSSRCGLAARDDKQAIEAWLASFGPERRHTLRSYRKEAERFLLWTIFERGKPLSSATTEDCTSYRDFLDALDGNTFWFWRLPRERWIGSRSTRWSDDWRPFAGPLSASSQKLAVTVLTAMCEWLVRQRYLDLNPWDGVPSARNAAGRIRADHSLTLEQWRTVMACCEDIEERDEAFYRLRFALLLAYGMGLRLSEMTRLMVARHQERKGEPHIGLKPSPDGAGWNLDVLGKGEKLRAVPMPDVVLLALQDYMEERGLGSDPSRWPETTPLLASLSKLHQHAVPAGQALSESALYRVFRAHFRRTARRMESLRDMQHLHSASTHWLRHTHATHALEAGAEIQEVQENLGHSSVAVTAIYTHASQRRKKKAVEQLMAYGASGEDDRRQ